jgi:hypothetical protein
MFVKLLFREMFNNLPLLSFILIFKWKIAEIRNEARSL